MKHKQLFPVLVLAVAWVAFNAGPTWTQTTPGKDQTNKEGMGERTGEEKMEARGTQESGQMERKKGEEEMEARGAQKPGRMGTKGAEKPEVKQTAGQRWSKDDVRRVQEALKDKGHDPGLIDGIMGAQTRQAIRAFQKVSGLKETRSLDAETAKKLGIEKGTAAGTSSQQGTTGQASPMQTQPSESTGK